jgi:hypothetical protein
MHEPVGSEPFVNSRLTPVATVQPHAHERSAFVQRWPALLAQMSVAAERGARLIVVPEGTVPG